MAIVPTSTEAKFADTAARLARDLDASAREHKRLSNAHRKAAQRDRERLNELLAFCRAAGIPIVIERKA